ncbi:MAG: malate synthase [Planctomycetes bacterium]|nr:malate synthase [Planctomycetota bacterium]
MSSNETSSGLDSRARAKPSRHGSLEIRGNLAEEYNDVYTDEAIDAMEAIAGFNNDRVRLMAERHQRRSRRAVNKELIDFLNPESTIGRTEIKVQDARDGKFRGSVIPRDLQRQWIQGTGPAAKPGSPLDKSLRNVAYALLSGADGWMFDGEDALGQTSTMALDNQRNLKIALRYDPMFLKVAESVGVEMNKWSAGLLGKALFKDFRKQLDFTTRIFRARGLHLDDRHVRVHASIVDRGNGFSASIVDMCLYVVNNYRTLLDQGRSIVLYLPKIQTAEEAALWNDMISGLEKHLCLEVGTVKCYVLIEQLEATFQLMEIRAALTPHFVGFNTGRWDYINAVSDALTWDRSFVNPNIEAVTMTYAYMRAYEDRVRRAVNTPDLNGNFALWQGGMEPNIPVGSPKGVEDGMKRAVAGGRRERESGASGKWVAHWKMVPIVRPVWEEVGKDNQMGLEFPRLTYTKDDAKALIALEPAPRTAGGARNLLSVALQYGNAFGQGMQAAALKPAEYFDNDDILYLMEDMATGEIRLSILWEWLHKCGTMTEDDASAGVNKGDVFTKALFEKLLEEEYQRLLKAKDKDVYDASKITTLPISRAIVEAYVLDEVKPPWFIDLLNINLDVLSVDEALPRIKKYIAALRNEGIRITENLDFEISPPK